MTRKVFQTDSGHEVWKGNKMVAVQDRETETVRVLKHGNWQHAGSANNPREILALLDEFGIF